MPRTNGRRLVIDACVAQSAGETEHPISSCCRRSLLQLGESGHYLVMSPEISAEWKKHGSHFATKWKAMMVARKRFVWLPDPVIQKLRAEIDRIEAESTRRIIAKDVHLVEAALATDEIVISRDSEAQRCLRSFAESAASIRAVMWICPVIHAEFVCEWLIQGAPVIPEHCLGHA